MRRSHENLNKECDDAERLLIRKNFDVLTKEEDRLLHDHLESCDHCRGYLYTLSHLYRAAQVRSDSELAPDPTIRQRLVQRMNVVKNRKGGIVHRGRQYMRRFLEYRIPVYQALVGVVLILLVASVLSQLSFSINRREAALYDLSQLEAPVLGDMDVVNNVELIQQHRIGRNVKEDSTLIRYISAAM